MSSGGEMPKLLKERGNEAFAAGNLDTALDLYTEAIENACQQTEVEHATLLAVLHKNRAAVHLRREDYRLAIDDCDKCLELAGDDPKALFRRCQAREALEEVELAYADAKNVLRLDPTNKAVQPVLERLHARVSAKVAEMSQLTSKVDSMIHIAFDSSDLLENRQKASENLVVLARDQAGANVLIKSDIVKKIASLMKVERDNKIRLALVRTTGELCKKGKDNVLTVLASCGIPFFMETLNEPDGEHVNAASYVIQTILDMLSDKATADKIRDIRRRPKETTTQQKKWAVHAETERCAQIKKSIELMSIYRVIIQNVSSRTISGLGRDAILELIMNNAKYDALSWAELMLKGDSGYHRLMEVACETCELKNESSMNVTQLTKSLVGVCLGHCYDCLYDDKQRSLCSEQIDSFVADKLSNPTMENQVRVMTAITALLRHAPELGQGQLGKEGVLSMMVNMAKSTSVPVQIAAVEALIAASAKRKDTSYILSNGLEALKALYHSPSDEVKVRALVGMCKIGGSSGHDASMRPFADGSSQKLAIACRKFLVAQPNGNDKGRSDLRRWAVEGLSYLSLDADVKEQLCEDERAVSALMDLARDVSANKQEDLQFATVTLFVNIVNAYDKQEILPEMVQLAKFAKHHIPEEHELDDPDFVDKRTFILAKAGLASALTSLAKSTNSKNVRELIARLFNAICRHAEIRGIVVQQGGTKALASLAVGDDNDTTEKGRRQAAQALARIGITQDPAIAFPGQRAVDIIRPLCSLLHADCQGLENFESLMALGNLATLNETTRARMLNVTEFASHIDSAMFEDHEMIRRAAVQCFANLCLSPIQAKRCEGKNDKIKYLVLLCAEIEDKELMTAATAALAMLTSQSAKCCHKIFEAQQWAESLLSVIANADMNIVLRAVVIVKNMIKAGKEIAEKLIETQIMDCLQAHIFKAQLDEGSFQPDETLQSVAKVAREALGAAHNMNLIKTRQEAETEQAARDEACITDDES